MLEERDWTDRRRNQVGSLDHDTRLYRRLPNRADLWSNNSRGNTSLWRHCDVTVTSCTGHKRFAPYKGSCTSSICSLHCLNPTPELGTDYIFIRKSTNHPAGFYNSMYLSPLTRHNLTYVCWRLQLLKQRKGQMSLKGYQLEWAALKVHKN